MEIKKYIYLVDNLWLMIKTQEAAVALLSLCGFLQQSTVAAHVQSTVNS